ncbi:hypothetical protein ES332_A10G038100v1 [Gossypium tomentosum]|uniref:Uncharacterized protein n=1 Tax=Gossypium tomentosum TaxID=34277 RepID=A0A5D2NLV0_GOSTO|nr:hypothetical protein ES332_A10G038100v1 [Gossypium tomentosum]
MKRIQLKLITTKLFIRELIRKKKSNWGHKRTNKKGLYIHSKPQFPRIKTISFKPTERTKPKLRLAETYQKIETSNHQDQIKPIDRIQRREIEEKRNESIIEESKDGEEKRESVRELARVYLSTLLLFTLTLPLLP